MDTKSSPVELFSSLDTLVERLGGNAANALFDGIVVGYSPTAGYIFVHEEAKIPDAADLPLDMKFLAHFENNPYARRAFDQDGEDLPLNLVSAIAESLPSAPEGKVYHLASIASQANTAVSVVFCGLASKPRARKVTFTKTPLVIKMEIRG